MEKQKKVVDASVIVKWFMEEDNSDKARILRNEHVTGKTILVIPELAIAEVINALRYKKFEKEKLKEVNKILWEFEFKIERLNENLMQKTIETALQRSLTIYDSVYVALAHLHGVPLITADKEIVHLPNVVSLKE